VLYITVPPAATARMVAAEFACFLGLPVRPRSNMTDIIEAVVGVCTDSRTGLMLVDEIHNVSQVTRAGGEVSDTLKYFSERIPATFVYAGIGLETSELLTGTRGAQIAGRFTLVPTRPFPYGDEWKGLVATMEQTLLLHNHPQGSLVKLDRYLHNRADGMIGALSHAIRGAAIDAILSGTERVTKEALDEIPLDHAAETVREAGEEGGLPVTDTLPEQLARLPVQVSLRLGEGTDSFIRRLAQANHLKPSYLRGCLVGPPDYGRGKRPRADRLAAVTGHQQDVLERVLADLVRKKRPRPASDKPKRRVTVSADKPALFGAIRRDAQAGEQSVRKLAAKHRVSPYLVRQALASPTPPQRKERAAIQGRAKGLVGPAIDVILDEYAATHAGELPTIGLVWDRRGPPDRRPASRCNRPSRRWRAT
jgi:hypothetical protein